MLYIAFCGLTADEEGFRIPVNKKAWSESFPDLVEFFERITESGRHSLLTTGTRQEQTKVQKLHDVI